MMASLTGFIKMRWLFNKRVGKTLLCFSVLGMVAFAVNVAGIGVTGDVQEWSAWLKDHASVFMVWRMALYLGVGIGWVWMRRRILSREDCQSDEGKESRHHSKTSPDSLNKTSAKQRFIRIEIAAVIALLTLEICH